MTMNIYQAALKLREDYAHTNITTDYVADNNLYLVFHDALHTLLGCAPEEAYEPQVLATEMILGGVDYTTIPLLSNLSADLLSNSIASIDTATLEVLIDFYTNYFS